MQTQIRIIIATCLSLACIPVGAQTSIAEANTISSMSNTLNKSSGPSSLVVDQTNKTLSRNGNTKWIIGATNISKVKLNEQILIPSNDPRYASKAHALVIPERGNKERGFELTIQSQFANQGMLYLKNRNFDEAIFAYEEAKKLDERYNAMYKKVIKLRDNVNNPEIGIEGVKRQKINKNLKLTWGQFLGWGKTAQDYSMLHQGERAVDPRLFGKLPKFR